MYRNSEGYADPTAGAAMARITHEEKKAKKRAQPAKKPAPGHPQERIWTLAWPKQSPKVKYKEVLRDE